MLICVVVTPTPPLLDHILSSRSCNYIVHIYYMSVFVTVILVLFCRSYFLFYQLLQNVRISHPSLKDVVDPVVELYEDVQRKALLRLEYENLTKCEAITSSTSKYYQKPAEYAMNRYAYYVCYKCGKVGILHIVCVHSSVSLALATPTPSIIFCTCKNGCQM